MTTRRWRREFDVVEDESVSFDVRPEARSRMISIRIPGDLLDSIRAIARARQVRYQSLIKRWLREAVRGEKRRETVRAKPGRANPGAWLG